MVLSESTLFFDPPVPASRESGFHQSKRLHLGHRQGKLALVLVDHLIGKERLLSAAEPYLPNALTFFKKVSPYADPLTLIRDGCEFLFDEFPDNPVAVFGSFQCGAQGFSIIEGVPRTFQQVGCIPEAIKSSMESGLIPDHLYWVEFKQEQQAGNIQLQIGLDRAPHGPATSEFLESLFLLFCWSAQFQNELWQQKLESLAEFAAGAGHEVNNPLGTIAGRTAQLLKSETDPERRRSLELIGAQTYRIRDMISDTMVFGRPPEPVLAEIQLEDVLVSVLSRFQTELSTRKITVDYPQSQRIAASAEDGVATDFAGELTPELTPKITDGLSDRVSVQADLSQLSTIFAELLRNSINAMTVPGQIRVQWMPESRGMRQGIRILWADSGVGLTQEQKIHCFDPFFSGRQAGRGLGFGLSKCWRFLQLHGGTISLLDTEPETTFEIWLPANQEKSNSSTHLNVSASEESTSEQPIAEQSSVEELNS